MLPIDDLRYAVFKDGGRGPHEYDCWGLASEIFRRYGVQLPDYQISCNADERIDEQINSERPNWVRCQGTIPIPALVVIRELGLCDHVGVYIGNRKFIHIRAKAGVAIEPIDHPVWKRRIEGFYVPR